MLAIRNGIIFVVLLGIASFAQARGSVVLINLENNSIITSSGKEPTLDAVAQAIRAAGASQAYPWTPSGERPGMLQLTTLVRNKHTVVVNVTFDAKTYSIRYSSSINMNYQGKDGKGIIHPFYNKWVAQLKDSIDAELRKL
ncbi:MAG: hypothetical protein EXR82_09435 [Gammaproteobacteria bacterium]|nr:hypothetical protein [Gammaproteobacteria bacterium]